LFAKVEDGATLITEKTLAKISQELAPTTILVNGSSDFDSGSNAREVDRTGVFGAVKELDS